MSGLPAPPIPKLSTTTLPATPTYVGSSSGSGSATTSTANPNDIWGLGALYGQQIILGVTPYQREVGDPLKRSEQSSPHPTWGTTQQMMQQVIDLWAAQQAERIKNPNALTQYEQLQQALWSAGAFGQTAYKDIHVGQWTDQTQNALVNAMTSYETAMKNNGGMPISFAEFLSQNGAGTQQGGINSNTSIGGTGPPQVQLTDPKAIRAYAQSAAEAALGHSLSESQLDKFVAQFQGAQAGAQTSTAATVSAPELSSEANAFAQQVDPNGFKGYQADAYTNALVNMFIPSTSARPNITPTPTA